jgi:mRNA-degrading endonuclease toxin of MazEF toxin-antitoxin module
VAKRGEVLVMRRRLGFGAAGRGEHFAVVQSDLIAGLDTALVCPLDADAPGYEGHPFVARVSSKEAGAKEPHVVLTHLVSAMSLARFEPAPAARLSPASMAHVSELLRLVLDL